MKTLFLALALSLSAAPAFAEMRKDGSFERYSFMYETVKPMTLKITVNHKTKDGCNHFGLSGYIRRQEAPAGVQTLQQDLVADLSVFSTLMGCRDLDQAREIVLESQPFVIQPTKGWVVGSILVPAGAKVTIE